MSMVTRRVSAPTTVLRILDDKNLVRKRQQRPSLVMNTLPWIAAVAEMAQTVWDYAA